MSHSLTGVYEIYEYRDDLSEVIIAETYLHKPNKYYWFEDDDWVYTYSKHGFYPGYFRTLMFKRYKL